MFRHGARYVHKGLEIKAWASDKMYQLIRHKHLSPSLALPETIQPVSNGHSMMQVIPAGKAHVGREMQRHIKASIR